MSGSGGFYKYRCKYFLTHNCPNWVYANGHACSMCLAEGRDDSEPAPTSTNPWHQQQYQSQSQNPSTLTEICVPQAFHGTLRYTVMELVPPTDGNGQNGKAHYWVLRQKAMMAPRNTFVPTTSDTPRPVVSMGMVGVGAGVRGY